MQEISALPCGKIQDRNIRCEIRYLTETEEGVFVDSSKKPPGKDAPGGPTCEICLSLRCAGSTLDKRGHAIMQLLQALAAHVDHVP